VLWNKAAETIFGRTAQEMLGHTDYEVFSRKQAGEMRQLDLASCCQNQDVLTPEEMVEHDGRTLYVKSRRGIIRGHDGSPRFLLIVAEDVTSERQARETVVHSAKLASLGEMAGSIAHEINNPLGVIHGNAVIMGRLLSRTPLDQGMLANLATAIVSTSERIEAIVKGLRVFSRQGEADPLRAEKIRDIIESATGLCAERFKSNGIELRVKLPPDDIAIACRHVQIGQVVLNLLNNAFDAVIKLPSPWVEIEVQEHSDAVELRITDSGLGIPEAVRKRIMEPFFTTKEVGKGTGIGLSISAGIMQHHGGSLSYDAECSNTRFVARFPKTVAGPDAQLVGQTAS
jgi:PAS domain S-box-containing protein